VLLLRLRRRLAGHLTSVQEERVKAYITANLSRRIDLKQIAEASGFDEHQLSIGFIATTGQSIVQWIAECRVARAKMYLRSTGETAAHVAQICGFPNEEALVEAFEHALGVTPDEWRARDRH
jgi:AraC-like DNA-binding protein